MKSAALSLLCMFALLATTALAAAPPQTFADRVSFDGRLNVEIPRDAQFTDETGRSVRLADYLGAEPVILVLAYYRCRNLCSVVLSSTVHALRGIDFDAGSAFQVVVVSIDPREDPTLAREQKAMFLEAYGRKGTSAAWHFLTGSAAASSAVAQSIGFNYVYDAKTEQYAHAAGITILTPQGRASRYLYGVQYAPRDVRLGLVEAADGKIGTPTDQLLLLCYHYDPARGTYGFVIMNVVRAAAGATVAALALTFWLLSARAKRRRRAGTRL